MKIIRRHLLQLVTIRQFPPADKIKMKIKNNNTNKNNSPQASAAVGDDPSISTSRQIPPSSQQVKVVDSHGHQGEHWRWLTCFFLCISLHNSFAPFNILSFMSQVLALINASNNSCTPPLVTTKNTL